MLLYFWHWPPHPGVSIAILGLLAALVSLKGTDKPWPRLAGAALVLLFLGLCGLEIYSVGRDTDERNTQHLRDIGESNRQFLETLGEIKTTASEVGQMKTRLHVLEIDASGLRKGQEGETLLIQAMKEDATKPLSDLSPDTLRKLVREDSQRLKEANFSRTRADDGPTYPPGARDKWSPERIAMDRKEFYDAQMDNYRRELTDILPEADTLRKLMLKKIGEHSPEDDHEAELFQAAINGNIREFSASYAADYLQSLSNRMKK